MTQAEIFNALYGGGNFSLPYLVKLTDEKAGDLYFINNNESINYEGNLYKAGTFDYTPPGIDGSGGSLSIDAKDNTLIEWVENAGTNMSLEIVGCLVSGGSVTPIHSYKHFHGSASYADNMVIEFSLSNDDRLDMTFTPYVYDTDNNRGNT